MQYQPTSLSLFQSVLHRDFDLVLMWDVCNILKIFFRFAVQTNEVFTYGDNYDGSICPFIIKIFLPTASELFDIRLLNICFLWSIIKRNEFTTNVFIVFANHLSLYTGIARLYCLEIYFLLWKSILDGIQRHNTTDIYILHFQLSWRSEIVL